jgi:hypothetical protein
MHWTSTSDDQKRSFIGTLQSFLLRSNPAWKIVFELYNSCRTTYIDVLPFVFFLDVTLPLIHPDTPTTLLGQAMAVTWVTIRSMSNKSTVREDGIRVFAESQQRIVPFISNPSSFAPSSCLIFRYALKIVVFSILMCTDFQIIELCIQFFDVIASFLVTG